ncbi:MAG: type I restriction-modification system subunit M [Chitinophagales bacterium]|nr:type I restriction-modification system subunit M [Chitinophagales bacterium]
MATKISQSEINNMVWKACDTFRGVIDPAQYKDYILTMLFIKYLSDVWKDKREEYMRKYNDDPERTDRAMKHERFVVPDHSTFDYLYDRRNEGNLGELINTALNDLEEANRTKLEGVFRNIDFNSNNLGPVKERNLRLKNLLNDFANEKLDLRPSHLDDHDIIGNAYEFLIGNFASDAGKKGGEFYTPKEVAQLLAKLLQPKPGARISDPTCGSGSLLIRVGKEVGSKNFSLYGQENNGSTWALCRMNMFLHEMDNADIEWGDTLNNPKLLEGDHLMKFDIVVANPPFSLDKWGADSASSDQYKRFWRGVPPKSKGDYAFITHMIESTYETHGKVGVVVPHGVLFRGSSEGRIRQSFIEENLLEAVIGLPSNLFFGTGIPAAILIFNRGKQTKDVLFIDASKEYEQGKNQNRLRTQDIEKIVSTYNAFRSGTREDVPKYAHVASPEEIKENDYNLNIPRYVDTFEEEAEVDIKVVQKEIDTLENELVEVKNKMKSYLSELGF